MIFPYIFGKVKEYVDDDVGKDAFFDGILINSVLILVLEMMLDAIRGIQSMHGNVVKSAN